MCIASAMVATSAKNLHGSVREQTLIEWETYKDLTSKNYHPEEEGIRLEFFETNLQRINSHNSNGSNHFVQSVNDFAAMSNEEKESYLGLAKDENRLSRKPWTPHGIKTRDVPSSVDYRNDKCLQAVKNQRSCGSCWAFAAIAPLEFSRCKKRNNKKRLLSEQQLVDCHPTYKGCNGGWYHSAWEYLKTGSNKDKKYGSYTARQGTCVFNKKFNGAKVKDYSFVNPNPDAIMEAVAEGPVAVAIRVVNDFYGYKEGIYSSADCEGYVNHAVVVVGYGTVSDVEYWIVRNSWGARWGNGGYILMEKGVNMCGIEEYVVKVEAK